MLKLIKIVKNCLVDGKSVKDGDKLQVGLTITKKDSEILIKMGKAIVLPGINDHGNEIEVVNKKKVRKKKKTKKTNGV